MFDKVLILSASAGAGHVRAAEAIEAAFKQSATAREVNIPMWLTGKVMWAV